MDTPLHLSNIIVHVISGTIALIIGFLILLKTKGTSLHVKLGYFFVYCMIVVVTTGAFGVIVFKRNLFLLLITILAAYNTYSGFRILKEKSNRFYLKDLLAMLGALAIALVFVHYLKFIGFYWNPVVIYSGVGYLLLVVSYDVFRYCIPRARYGNLWRYEHSSKMISAMGALLSAFIGTLLPDYKPYSQILPSLLMTLIMIFFNIKIYFRLKK
ncbi:MULTISPECIES: hypothetical protein [unclassified Chryseobacterium]|uniref:hypothetical protein n=1 Tax=unclassified Chryseobacterium TaxID=2593645 RepID=UPI000F47F5F8|nr:hypothetical protein [Chryseobacterium sp. BIGb0232]MCS4304762.1 hypothetical protein [Chryseobacterium sp. BIGb0232]ROS20581.1 hypothetical protein EDF65_1311 [Chryseobacterium nakagawai]